ncbi:mandelate racemase/muconate lactonizing enzyme family protein [Natrinema gelatinilyticum]|uniref:mandelate racemase/muconate lactonizing enzyme family protein n=1 Tax=Natrinema gelatinilyticum TaxID=2961571 RepID=UPI0020C43BEB|nr:mandelate racemase/muconate lactonizing enzyme family protein [Natrinema gelatinilyticum]
MEITDVRAVPLSHPIPESEQHRTDLGTKVKNDALLVSVETDEEITGIGEALAIPTSVPTAIKAVIEDDLKPMLIGEDPTYTERLWEKMYNGPRFAPAIDRGYSQPRADRRGITMEAIAGVDIALWDVKGKALGEPVYELLGPVRDSIRAYASGGWAPGEEAETELGEYVDQGFDAVKMRVVGEGGFSIEKTRIRVEAARRGIGSETDLMLDAHGSLDAPTAIKLARRLEQYDIAWLEEPVSPDNHDRLAEVRRATEIPIATGEVEHTRFDFHDLFAHDAVDIVQPDLCRAGGFTEVRRIAALASAEGARIAPHAFGSAVLFAAGMHAALALPNCHLLEVPQGDTTLLDELFEESFDVRNGTVHAPDRPGLGFTLCDDVCDRFEYIEGPEYVF